MPSFVAIDRLDPMYSSLLETAQRWAQAVSYRVRNALHASRNRLQRNPILGAHPTFCERSLVSEGYLFVDVDTWRKENDGYLA